MEAEGRYVRQSGGRGWYARVKVRYFDQPPDADALRAELSAELQDDRGWYAGWREAAALGAALGLELAGASGRCQVTAVDDRMVPSAANPAVIAVAAVRAAWAAVAFVPDEATARRVEECVAGLARLSLPQPRSD